MKVHLVPMRHPDPSTPHTFFALLNIERTTSRAPFRLSCGCRGRSAAIQRACEPSVSHTAPLSDLLLSSSARPACESGEANSCILIPDFIADWHENNTQQPNGFFFENQSPLKHTHVHALIKHLCTHRHKEEAEGGGRNSRVTVRRG